MVAFGPPQNLPHHSPEARNMRTPAGQLPVMRALACFCGCLPA